MQNIINALKKRQKQKQKVNRRNQQQNIGGRKISQVEDRLVEITDVEKKGDKKK